MKNAYKVLAAVAVSAFLTVSAGAFAADGSTPAASTQAKATHHRHHHHHKMECKKDKKGHCMHHAAPMKSSSARPHEDWMGTSASDYYRHD